MFICASAIQGERVCVQGPCTSRRQQEGSTRARASIDRRHSRVSFQQKKQEWQSSPIPSKTIGTHVPAPELHSDPSKEETTQEAADRLGDHQLLTRKHTVVESMYGSRASYAYGSGGRANAMMPEGMRRQEIRVSADGEAWTSGVGWKRAGTKRCRLRDAGSESWHGLSRRWSRAVVGRADPGTVGAPPLPQRCEMHARLIRLLVHSQALCTLSG